MMRRLLFSVIGAVIAIKLISMFSPEFGHFLVNLLNYLLDGLIKFIQWLQHLIQSFLN